MIRCVEEYWPGQRKNIRTARIEILIPDEKWPIEVGRITCDDPVFSILYNALERIEIAFIQMPEDNEGERE